MPAPATTASPVTSPVIAPLVPTTTSYITVPNINSAHVKGPGPAVYVGQTFQALPGDGISLTIKLGWRPVTLRLLVTEVTIDGSHVTPTNILFESSSFTSPTSQTPALGVFTFALGALPFTAGATYAFLLDGYSDRGDTSIADSAQIGVANISGRDAYLDGAMFLRSLWPFPHGSRASHLADGFALSSDQDLAFRMAFDKLSGPLVGTATRDVIIGGNRAMRVLAGDGADLVTGGGLNDRVAGEDGNDVLSGLAGADTLFGAQGQDKLSGGSGNDQIWGGSENDTLDGAGGADLLDGGSGNDTLLAGPGRDTLRGGLGNDLLDGQSGGDELYGGFGADRFVFTQASLGSVTEVADFKAIEDDLILLDTGGQVAAGPLDPMSFFVGAAAPKPWVWLVYTPAAALLSYDPDGSGPEPMVPVAHFAPGTLLTAADFYAY